MLYEADVLFLQAGTDGAYLALEPIVKSTVVEHQLHIVHILLQFIVLIIFQLGRDGAEIHWFLDNVVVIGDAKGLNIDWLAKDVGLGIPLQGGQEALGGLLPLVENGSCLFNFWNLERVDGRQVGVVFVVLEVFGNGGVGELELLELFISHGLVMAVFLVHGEEIALSNLPLIGLGLLIDFYFAWLTCTAADWTFLLGVEGNSTILQEELKNLLLIVFLGPVRWSKTLLVFHLHVHPFLNEVFDDVVSLQLDGIVDRALLLVVDVVVVGAVGQQELSGVQVALSDAVEDASLTVLVASIDVAALLNEQFTDIRITFSGGVEEWTLLQIILSGGVGAHVDENLAHLNGRFFVLHDAGGEDDGLAEVLLLVDERGDVDVIVLDHADDVVDVTFLDLVEQLFPKRALNRPVRVVIGWWLSSTLSRSSWLS